MPDADKAAGGGTADNQRPGALQGALQIYFQGTYYVQYCQMVPLKPNFDFSRPNKFLNLALKVSFLLLTGFSN